MSSDFQLFAAAPFANTPSTVAIAAARSGQVGLIDLEYIEPARARSELERLARLGSGRIGIKLAAADAAQIGITLGPAILERLDWVILIGDGGADEGEALSRLRRTLGPQVKIAIELRDSTHM